MGYISRTLMPGEHVVYSTRLHWVIFFWPLFFFAVSAGLVGFGVLGGGVGVLGAGAQDAQKPDGLSQAGDRLQRLETGQKLAAAALVVGSLLAVMSGLSLLGRLVLRATSEFAVTNKRVVIKVGVLRTLSVETLLSRVESVVVRRGPLGWLLGYGSIEVKGIGGTVDPFYHVSNPMELRLAVQTQASAADR